MSNTLVIVGNGFDLWHGLPTSYADFKIFLENNGNHKNFLEDISKYIDESALWSDFEHALGEIDDAVVLGDSDFGGGGDYNMIRERLSFHTQISEKLRLWLSSVVIESSKELDHSELLAPHFKYLNFNYTSTLEKLYRIESSNIFYIHGSLQCSTEKLICGHNTSCPYGSYFNIPTGKSGLLVVESPENALIEYYEYTRKDSEIIISNNQKYFEELNDVSEIFILGHSMGDVDKEYFREIACHVQQNSMWNISYHSEKDKNNIKKTMQYIEEECGISPQIEYITLDSYAFEKILCNKEIIWKK